MTDSTTLAPVTLSTIMTLNVRTWIEQPDTDTPLAALMLTYPAPQFDDADPVAVERTMRGVAASLGAVPAGAPVPDVGVRLTVHGGEALLWFTDCSYGLRVRHLRWMRALERAGRALLAVGLDELSPVASVAEVDEYREAARGSGRMHLALAHLGRRIGGAS
jgi:hypothetical protein